MIERIHHIDFVVRDLELAIDRWTRLLDRSPRDREELPGRGVVLARFQVGEIWIILVQPTRDDSPVQTYLNTFGEGFFHIAWAVEDLEVEAERLHETGLAGVSDQPRRGVEGWRLLDIDAGAMFGVMSQLVEERGACR